MVVLLIKKGDQPQFLYEAPGITLVDEVIDYVCEVYNGRLKIDRIVSEMSELADHGLCLPPNMQGLTDDQIVDLKLKDEWGEKCTPSGGFIERKDDIGRRNGKAPTENLVAMLNRTKDEVKALISADLIKQNKFLKKETIREALMMLSGVMTIIYPMGLPPHETIRMELDNEEDLSGTQAGQEVLPVEKASLWFCGKEMQRGCSLAQYTGGNEKTRLVAKLTARGHGPPGREPVISEAEQRALIAHYHRRQEEVKRLEANSDDAYLDAAWADSGQLKRNFHGLGDIKWGPR